tara:strand:+ start:1060 stop:1371 length:312 start_codon:yes stop_codon:yes gene_type:complete
MNYTALEHRMNAGEFEDPFDIYETFVRNTEGSPEEQEVTWLNHIGIDKTLDLQLKTTLAVRLLMDMQRTKQKLDAELLALWDEMWKMPRRSARLNGKRVQVKF